MGFCVLKAFNWFFRFSWKEKTCLLSAVNIEHKNFDKKIHIVWFIAFLKDFLGPLKEASRYFRNYCKFRVFCNNLTKLQLALSPRLLEIRTCYKYIKCCIFDFLSDGARPIRVQLHILWKVAKNDIYVASDMARSARGSARAPIKLSKSDWSIKIDAFSLFDHCHSFKTHRDTESWSLVKNWKWNFWHLRLWIFWIFPKFYIFCQYSRNFNELYLRDF